MSHLIIESNYKTVMIDGGKIEGIISGDVLSFKGIPYAAPPIGNLRWRSPQPVTSWLGVRRYSQYGHDCVQSTRSYGLFCPSRPNRRKQSTIG